MFRSDIKYSSKDYKVIEKANIEVQLVRLQRQLQDLIQMLADANDQEFASEMIAISDVSLRLQNLALFKTLLAKEISKSKV